MDFGKIKKLVKQNGDKIIVFEDGEPEVVVMAFHEYEKLMKVSAGIISAAPAQETFIPLPAVPPAETFRGDQLFSDFGHFNSFEEETGEPIWPSSVSTEITGASSGMPLRLEDVRLEDLPIEG